MDLEVGSILEGKVTGITKFGAFVALDEGKSGMVHISEVATTFVSNIQDFLSEGQAVKVKVIGIDDIGRINLSIKKAQENHGEAQQRDGRAPNGGRPQQQGGRPPQAGNSGQRFQNRPMRERQASGGGAPRGGAANRAKDPASMTFEDKLKAFMSDSETRQADVRHTTDRKNGTRRRK